MYQERNVHLPNIQWCSFEKFVNATLEIFDEPLINICSVQIKEILQNITPNNILEHCGNKIVWPYSNKTILKQEVWEEWLLYLIIRSIENPDNIKNADFYVIRNADETRKVKVLYASNHTKLPDFLKDYLENAYQDIDAGQVMIVRTDITPAAKTIPSKKIDKIVADISSAISINNHMYIDDVTSNIGQVSIIHIRALVDEMINFINREENDGLEMRKLETKLGKRLKEVLYGI